MAAPARPALAALLLLTAASVHPASSSLPCVTDTISIFQAEAARLDVDSTATYTVCPNTTMPLGEPTNPPLSIFNPRVRILCGDDGRSSGGCVVDGRGAGAAAAAVPSVSVVRWSTVAAAGGYPPGVVDAPDRPDRDIVGVEIRGLTFRGGGGPFLYAGAPTSLALVDCVFTEANAIGSAMVMDGSFLFPTAAPTAPPSAVTEPPSAAPTTSPRPTTEPSAPPTDRPTASRAPSAPPTATPAPTATARPSPEPTLVPLEDGLCDERRPCADNPDLPCCSVWGACGREYAWCAPENCVSGCWNGTTNSTAAVPPSAAPSSSGAPPSGGGGANAAAEEASTPAPANAADAEVPGAGAVRRRRRAGGGDGGAPPDPPSPFRLRIEGCTFGGNGVALGPDGGTAALLANVGGEVEIADTRFVDNDVTNTNGGYVLVNHLGRMSVSRSCFAGNVARANVANFALRGAEYANTENFGDLGNPSCNGVIDVRGGDPSDAGTWEMLCDDFDAGECPLDAGAGAPTSAPDEAAATGTPVSAPGAAATTDAPAAATNAPAADAPTAKPAAERPPTRQTSAVGNGGCASVVAALVVAIVVPLL